MIFSSTQSSPKAAPSASELRGWSPFDRLLLMLPLLAVVLGLLLEYTDMDLRLARLFFDPVSMNWPMREHWLTEVVLHKGARAFMVGVGVLNFVAILVSFVFAPLAQYRKLLVCLLLAMGLGPLVVGYFKGVTHIYSPWDLSYFGGKQEYVKLLDKAPLGSPVGHAFPAGHSSSGFALVAFYFALGMVDPARRFHGLALGLVLGFLFGFAQQMRGAHFLSHDLFSLAVCWCCSWLVFSLFFGRKLTAKIDSYFG